MERFKKLLIKLLYPHIAIALLIVIISTVGLAYVFTQQGLETHIVSYLIYAFSFYALCIVVANVIPLIKKMNHLLHGNAHTSRYLSEAELRARISLYLGTLINIGYAVLKLITGVVYSSFWFGAVAIYYMVLSIIRFLLIRADRKSVKLTDDTYRHEWKSYRLCGVLLLLLNTTMSGMVFQMVWQNKGYSYPGFVIYASAAYTFYRLTVAIIKICSKKIVIPILLSTKALDLSMALMSMFALQTAMFASFGAGMAAESRRLMNALTGGTVCFAVVCIALFMIIKSMKKLRINKVEI